MSASKPNKGSTRPVSVEVKNLTRKYGDFVALDNVSFEVHAGEIVGFLGPNGAGKTTAMKILTCFMGASSGQARVAGFDVAEQSMEVRKRVGYLPETVPLYPDMLVYDYLAFIARMRQVPADKIESHIRDTAKVCGLTHRINSYIRELSKGYRQRVGLAQALIHKPEVVILDEPTSGLDPNQIVEIRDLIKDIGREKTIIFSTHILSEVAAVCDRIIIVNQGKLVADGTVQELEARVRKEDFFNVVLAGKGEAEMRKFAQHALKLKGAKQADVVDSQGKQSTVTVSCSPGANIGSALAKIATELGLELVELRRDSLTLEDIFRTLTGDAEQVAAERRRRALRLLSGDGVTLTEADKYGPVGAASEDKGDDADASGDAADNDPDEAPAKAKGDARKAG